MQENNTAWGRPFTTRRYLSGPVSNFLVTTWPDAKVVVGEIWGKGDPEVPSGAFYFLYGENAGNFDYKKVTYHTHPEGYPIHGQTHDAGDYTFTMESLCNNEPKPTTYTKVTLKNHVPWSVHEKLWIILRTGKETELTGQMDTDGNRTYKPEPTVYGKMPCHYRMNGNVVSDGRFHLVLQSDSLPFSWYDDEDAPYKYQRRLVQIDVDLAPGEEKSMTLSFGTEHCGAFDYEKEKAACEAFWDKELQRIKVFPEQLKSSPEGYCMYRNLV
ncbi:MAG: hypothetical protein IJC25_00875, partial [Clostridia bacterium]|nr:hypothetical protein [Clostridia bacterium]